MRSLIMRALGVATAIAAVAPITASAQNLVYLTDWPKHAIGVTGTLARPVGEFQDFVSWGGGLSAYWTMAFDRGRHYALRVDATGLLYGHERFYVPLSPTIGRIQLSVSTDNFIVGAGAGPEFATQMGALRPYLFGTVGFSYFATVSSVDDDNGGSSFANTTNFDDWRLALTAGTGVQVLVSHGRKPIALDFGAVLTRNGTTDYLTRGGVIDNGDGTVTLLPIRSNADLLTMRVGVVFGL